VNEQQPNTAMAIELVDTHAHLDDSAFDSDREAVIENAARAGVRQIVNIGYRPERWASTVALTERYTSIVPTFGIHPQHAEECTPDTLRQLREMLLHHHGRAVGEIGLDFYRDGPPPEVQRAAFAAQLDLAADLDLPVVIHQRAAERECLAMLRETPPALTVVLHSFDATDEMASVARERGWILGVGGLMTKQASEPIREILKDFPLDQLVLETDSPYLTPRGIKARRNEPANVAVIARRLAELRQIDMEEVARTTTQTACRIFKLDAPVVTGAIPGGDQASNER
jgi:TatD DNase family protein